MDWREAPAGMVRYDELVNILTSLSETGGCDRRTLRIVAQAVGVREYFDLEETRLSRSRIVIEEPVLLLEK